jgi:hypothetical protein
MTQTYCDSWKRKKQHEKRESDTARLAFNGYGGVEVQNPISLRAAQLRARNGKDTFRVRKSRAERVVDQDG